MAKPLTTFADATTGVINILEAKLDEDLDADVTARTPTAKVPSSGLPLVVVRQDAAFPRYPIDEPTTIRVTVYHKDEVSALDLAKLCRAYICSTHGTNLIRATRALTGPVPTSDPDTGEPVATFTVRVHTRPTAVA